MAHMIQLPAEILTLRDNVDLTLMSVDLSREPKRVALIALDFCELLTKWLSDDQSQAVEVARKFWSETGDDKHQEWVGKFAHVLDLDQRSHAHDRDVAMNRLVWTALNTNMEFDGYACEFLIVLGFEVGLNAEQMHGVLVKYIPGLC